MAAPSHQKRPGSPIGDHFMPATKVPRTQTNQLQINYLVRQKQDTLPLVTPDERMTKILQLVGEYDGVLQRHESMAGNLGACPLGPILLKRFERLFEGPPRVLKSHAKDPSVTWLDVVEFAQNRPEQFNLEKQRNGVRVCQFYHKQCRVEISEEDYVLIASGMPQKLIPPQPILEDEEKELGVMEILERNLAKVVQMADQVSARARQLNHKLKNRRSAILARRESEADPQRAHVRSTDSPTSPMDLSGVGSRPVRSIETSQSPPLGFTAVNMRQSGTSGNDAREGEALQDVVMTAEASSSTTHNASDLNGKSIADIPPSLRADNISKFLTESERQAGMTEDTVRRSSMSSMNRERERESLRQSIGNRFEGLPKNSDPGWSSAEKQTSSVLIPGTPASLIPQAKPPVWKFDDGGPHKAEMVARMENMQRGERIIPPCDRCRRLQMDCMKNLTACQGCTKKHAKCSWKDVTLEELKGHSAPIARKSATPQTQGTTRSSAEPSSRDWDRLVKDNTQTPRPRPEDGKSDHHDIADVSSSTRVSESRVLSPGGVATGESTPRLDVRPPPLEQQIRDATEGRIRGHHSSTSYDQSRSRPGDFDPDEGDRLKELARQVYRSASQSTKPPE